jgi:hypothetical protein
MHVRIRNLTKRLVIVEVGRENVHLGAGETSAPLDAAQVRTNIAVDKLVKTNVIAVVPDAPTPAPARARKSVKRPKKVHR